MSCGVDVLLQRQDQDGFWREFDLQPGASEAWTTAWVGWCLTRAVPDGSAQALRIRTSCGRAAASVWNAQRSGGWGYNRRSGPDADTTSWVLRFLTARGLRVEPAGFLTPYIDPGGGVHTFRDSGYGAWTHAHDDVAANAGLALVSTPTARSLVARIERRLVARFPGDTYWWSTPIYGAAWMLRFIDACGDVSETVHDRARRWIEDLPPSDSPFELAHRLLASRHTERSADESLHVVNRLLDLAGRDGWPGGSFLLVPPRGAGPQAAPNPELRGLLTTAICVAVLSEWIGRLARS